MPLDPAARGENNVKKVTSVHGYASKSGQNNSALQLVPLLFVGPPRAAQVCAYKRGWSETPQALGITALPAQPAPS